MSWVDDVLNFFKMLAHPVAKPAPTPAPMDVPVASEADLFISADALQKVFPHASPVVVGLVANKINGYGAKFGLKRGLRLDHFLAHIFVESEGLTHFEEDLVYTSAARINAIFGSTRAPLSICPALVRNPKALALQVYGGQWGLKNLGNRLGTSDAWDCRGSGVLQITGYYNFGHIGTIAGFDLVGNPDQARDPAISVICALAYWNSLGLWAAADRDDILATTKLVNGGTLGLSDRTAELKKLKGTIPQSFAGLSTPTEARLDERKNALQFIRALEH